MRAVVQRVVEAEVVVEGRSVGAIERGLLVYLGVGAGDGKAQAVWMAAKLRGLRIFEDDAGKMSRSVEDIAGSVLVVSQFTLFGDVRKGRRPSFDAAAPPEVAQQHYEEVVSELRNAGVPVQTGRFRAKMNVTADVAGPVTILVDSERQF